ncbi:DMT family transporter [Deinococcus hopiensis]|nr:DMT family transporter [Deinococcus hopiensis]
MPWLPMLVAVLVGTVIPLRTANSRLAQVAGHSTGAALISVTLTLLGTFVLLVRPGHASALADAHLPWWTWIGGASGMVYLLGRAALAPRLGTATLLSPTVLGQLLAAGLLEHVGWLGLPQHALTPERLLGPALVAWVVLVRQF